MTNCKLIVTDSGDPSVGIYPQSWAIESPFREGEQDDATLDDFRKEIISIYREFCDGRCSAEYDFEMKYKDIDGGR